VTDEKQWPPADDPEGPDAEEIDESSAGDQQGSDGDMDDNDAAGTSDPHPYG